MKGMSLKHEREIEKFVTKRTKEQQVCFSINKQKVSKNVEEKH